MKGQGSDDVTAPSGSSVRTNSGGANKVWRTLSSLSQSQNTGTTWWYLGPSK